MLPTLLETHTPDAVVLMLGTNDCKTIFGASAEIIGKGIVRLLEQINQYADKMKVLVISPIYLGEKVWQDGYDQEFSPESVEVSKKLEPVYEKSGRKVWQTIHAGSRLCESVGSRSGAYGWTES